jgi:hypothetical protein
MVILNSRKVFLALEPASEDYTQEDVQAALEAIANGAGAREASLHWGVPRSTLYK